MPNVVESPGPTLLHVVTRNNPRGAERVAVDLADALAELGWSQRIVALRPGRIHQGELALPVMGHGPFSILRRLRREIRIGNPDVVLAHGGAAALYASAASFGTTSAVVWQRILEFPAAVWASRVRRRQWHSVAGRCAGVIALSAKAAVEMSRLGYSGPVTTINNHRPRTVGRPRQIHPQIAAGRELRSAVFGFVGHLVEQKDPVAAVRIADQVLTRVPSAHFVIVGDGPLRGEVERLVRATPTRARMHILGHVDDVRNAVLPYLDLLIITSRTESMTGVAIEALMAECPVVSFELDGLDVLLRDTGAGTLVPHGDDATFIDQIEELLASPSARESMRSQAREHKDAFATETVATQYHEFLSRFLPHGPRPVAHVMPNIGVGGAEQALAVMAANHNRDEWRPIVMTLHAPRRPIEETVIPTLTSLDVEVVNLGLAGRADRSPVALINAVVALRRAVKERNIKVVDSALFEADLTSRLAVMGLPVAHVTHLVNTTYDSVVLREARGRGQWRFHIVRLADRLTGKRTGAFVPLTRTVAHSAQQQLGIPQRKVHVVPRGVDTTRFPALPPKTEPVRHLLAIGRLVPQKNYHRLIDAMALTSGLELTIVGEGPLLEELCEHIDRTEISDRVRIMPPTRDVPGLHSEHDAFVMLSLWEGQSNALLEAMASGRPILVSDIDVFREVIGDLGLYVDPNDVRAISDGLQSLTVLTEQTRRQTAEQLRAVVESRFSPKTATRRLESVYAALLGFASNTPPVSGTGRGTPHGG